MRLHSPTRKEMRLRRGCLPVSQPTHENLSAGYARRDTLNGPSDESSTLSASTTRHPAHQRGGFLDVPRAKARTERDMPPATMSPAQVWAVMTGPNTLDGARLQRERVMFVNQDAGKTPHQNGIYSGQLNTGRPPATLGIHASGSVSKFRRREGPSACSALDASARHHQTASELNSVCGPGWRNR